MLTIVERPTFVTAVTVNTKALKGTFRVTYVAKDGDWLESAQKEGDANGKGFKHWLPLVVDGFEDVVLPDGPLDGAKPESLPKLLAWAGVGPAMVAAYFRALWEEEEKNS